MVLVSQAGRGDSCGCKVGYRRGCVMQLRLLNTRKEVCQCLMVYVRSGHEVGELKLLPTTYNGRLC